MPMDNLNSTDELLRNSPLYRNFQADREEILKYKWTEIEPGRSRADIDFVNRLTDRIKQRRGTPHR